MQQRKGLVDKSPRIAEIIELYENSSNVISDREFARRVILLDPTLKASTLRVWFQKRKENLHYVASKTLLGANTSLLAREMERKKQQIELRQDATELMRDFVANLKTIVSNKADLKAMPGKSITEVYRIIREEEDRQKALGLRERAENRADAQFAFMLSITKAGQLSDEDIEFLSDDLKKDLEVFKQANGIYQLPGQESMEGFSTAPEVLAPLAGQERAAGIV